MSTKVTIDTNVQPSLKVVPSFKATITEWLVKLGDLFKITWKYALIYITLSYLMNIIFFWALDDAGRKEFAKVTFCFGRLHAMFPVQFFLGSLVFLAINRWFQAYQTMLPGTNKLMRYYSTALKMIKEDDPSWPAKRSRMIKKWNDWVLLAWLLTIRVTSTPLNQYYPTLKKIKEEGLMTEFEFKFLTDEKKNKNLEDKELSLVIFEWLALLNETSAPDYRAPADLKANFDAIQALKKSGSNLIKFSTKNIPKLMIHGATLSVYLFCISSILGHNILEFEKDPFTGPSFSTTAIVGAFFYPVIYASPIFLYCIWLRYLRSTTDPFGWDEDDIDVLKIFKGHIENAKHFCNNPGIEYVVLVNQINNE